MMLSKIWDPKTARVLFTALIFALVLLFLRDASETLTLFLFAILFAYFVDPLVSRLEKPVRGRIKAIAAVYVVLLLLVTILGIVVGPKIADEAKSLATSLPSLAEKMGSGQLVAEFGTKHGWSSGRQSQVQDFFVSHRDGILGYGKVIGTKLASPVQHVWWLILIPILSLFFLKDGHTIAETIVNLGRLPEEKRTLRGIVTDVNVMLGSYIRAQIILASLTLVAYTLVLSVMRVPYAFILGPLAGIFEFVPVVGPAIAAISVLLIAILTSYPHVLWVFLFVAIWRLVQDYVNGPRILGESLELSPLVQIFAVLAGGEIGGVVGALIAVPVVATLRIFLRRMTSGGDPDTPVTAAGRAEAYAGATR